MKELYGQHSLVHENFIASGPGSLLSMSPKLQPSGLQQAQMSSNEDVNKLSSPASPFVSLKPDFPDVGKENAPDDSDEVVLLLHFCLLRDTGII